MKKLLTILLTLTLSLSLFGCGGESTPSSVGKSSKAEAVTFGDVIETNTATFTFDSAYVSNTLGTKTSYISAASGMKMFCIVGDITNNTNSELNLTAVFADMTFNGEYNFRAHAAVEYSNRTGTSLPTLMAGRLILYAEIPDTLVDKLSRCEARLAFSEGMNSPTLSFEDGAVRYQIALSEEECREALAGPQYEVVYFDECPVLPTPESYGNVRQSTRNQRSSGGVVEYTTYGYTVIGSQDVNPIVDNYLDQLQSLGLHVQDGVDGHEIYWEGRLLATVDTNNGFKVKLEGGNEGLFLENGVIVAPPEESAAPALALGELIKTDYLELLLDKTGATDRLESGKDKYGRYRYYSSLDGSPYFYLQGTFKNTGSTPVDITRAYIQFTFDDTYSYEGSMTGFVDGTQIFVEEINPLATVNCYLYVPVPQELLDTYEICTVTIGFDKDFGIRSVTQNGLPLFSKCDDVFVMEFAHQ